MVDDYKQLTAWKVSMELMVAIYTVTRSFPQEERFGLTNQLRRAAVSIPSNIAEGQGRGSRKEFSHFLRIANGSRQEAETQLLGAIQLGFVETNEIVAVFELITRTGQLIHALRKSIEKLSS